MWFIGVEVEQETSAPPPKKNPGSASAQRCHIVSNGYNIFPTLQRCVVLKIVVAYRPV